jgi:glycosyltransferase involved in cell wall biosynthesis
MACGLPVVSTKCGGPEDFVNDSNGILCEKENPEALRNGVKLMMLEHARYSPESLKTFASNFSPESFTSRITQVYKFVLKN